jgi:hypothetical protein
LKNLETDLETEGVQIGTIIQNGIEKLEGYSSLALENPAYLLSVGEWLFYKAA